MVLNADTLLHFRTGMDWMEHFKLPLVWSTSDIIWGCSASSLQTHNYTLHQIVWSKHTSTFSFAIQRHSLPTCSKRGCYRSFMAPIPKWKHHLKSNIIKTRMEVDHKKKQSKPAEWTLLLWESIFNLLLPGVEVQQTYPRSSKTLSDLLAF